ncbi:mechanosensitive ion channel protein MscS [Sphingomonas sp. Leaf407]|uniref:mechanosensitive ion channel family protein n=1 Tax=unclassified Sphingomonas TaxID=196159 RepID=UPI0006FF8A8D|nr:MULTISPECIES: mechanosensitive ion channel domain-containing protein [unclassified Sphingomonas]KQN36685.1 mechanosensitive ion channel protein MscS [Sphingomonas sp. Leaf42]KQT27307.1 mechanosensitive ion channel protein MscS [Sphingomonas sp. Leaf407]
MNPAAAWLAARGVPLPDPPQLVEAGVALGCVLLSLALGWFAGRRWGPALSQAWAKRVGDHVVGIAPRICDILRHLVAVLVLAVVAQVRDWGALADIVIGLALGAAVARLAVQLLRGVGLARWIAWTVAAILFVSALSGAIGGLGPITNTLDAIGFSVGRRRLSLLAVVSTLLTVVVLYAVVRLTNRIVAHGVAQAGSLDPAQKLLAQKLASIAIVIVAFFFGVDLLGIDLTTFAIFSGGLGLAVGFGLQKTIGNLIAGIILLMDRSIKPGDVIVVGDSFGWVNKIGVRAVSVITRDGKEHLIPNENLMTQEVENWSFSDRNVRVRIPVGVGYETDLRLAQKLMLQAAQQSPRVLRSPKPNVWLISYGEYAVEHEILAWISDPEQGVGNVRSDVLNRLWDLFKENGITIPVPRREVMIRDEIRMTRD